MKYRKRVVISCDAITTVKRQSSLEFIIEYITADHYVGFYELFILWTEPTILPTRQLQPGNSGI